MWLSGKRTRPRRSIGGAVKGSWKRGVYESFTVDHSGSCTVGGRRVYSYPANDGHRPRVSAPDYCHGVVLWRNLLVVPAFWQESQDHRPINRVGFIHVHYRNFYLVKGGRTP